MVPQGPRCWMAAPNRAKLGPAFCCLNGSSVAKGSWVCRTTFPGGHHQAPCLETSVKQKQPTSPLSHLVVPSLTIECKVSLRNINSIWIIWKEWLVPEAGQLQWKWDCQCLVGYQCKKNSGLEMADKIQRWMPMYDANGWGGWFGVVCLMLCLGVCSTLWMLIEWGWDF